MESSSNNPCWLDDNELVRISRQSPSTPFGAQLMRDVWPKRYTEGLSSETYRGCATVLSMLCAGMRRGIGISEIDRLIESVDQSIKTSNTLPAGSHQLGGAALTITNAWECAHCGYTSDQIAAAYKSELIYAAKLFVAARQHGWNR